MRGRSGGPPSGLRSRGQPPSRPPPFRGEGRKRRRSAPSSNDDDAGESHPRRLRSSPPSLLSSPLSGGRSGGGSGAGARAGGGGSSPGPPSRGEKRGRGGEGAGAVGRPPVRSAEPGSTPLPTSPLPGGRRENGGDPPLRPRTMMPESPGRAVCVPPPWKGGGREGGPRGRAGQAAAGHPPGPLPRGIISKGHIHPLLCSPCGRAGDARDRGCGQAARNSPCETTLCGAWKFATEAVLRDEIRAVNGQERPL